MATFWLSDAGNDANDGTSYAQAKATLSAAIALLSQGDTLNCVGLFSALSTPITINGNTLRGTSYADPSCIIRGTDSEGNPAFCTVTAPNNTNRFWLQTSNRPNYLVMRGFIFDYGLLLTAQGIGIRTTGSGQFPVRVEYCQAFGNEESQFFYRPRLVQMSAAFAASQVQDPGVADVRFCYLRDAELWGDNSYRIAAYRCVFRYVAGRTAAADTNQSLVQQDTQTSHRGVGMHAVNCTVDLYFRGDAPRPGPVFREYYNGNSADKVNAAHSNLICVASSYATEVGQTFIGGIIPSSVAASGTFTGVVGYNAFLFDAQLQAGINHTGVNAPSIYLQQLNPGYPGTTSGTNLYPTDHRFDNAIIGDIVNTTAPWTWEDVDDSGYDILLGKDYRLVNSTLITAAYDGGPVGAIAERTNAPPVIYGDQDWDVVAGNTVSVSAGAGLALMSFDADGDPLTWEIIDNVTHGTLNLNTNTGAYDYTPDLTYEGDDTFTWRVCDPTECTSYIVDTSQRPKVLFRVAGVPTPTPGDYAPNYPLALDSLPFYKPVLMADAQVRVVVQRNKNRRHIDFAHYLRRERWNEMTTRYKRVGASTNVALSLAGVESAKAFMLQTDQDLVATVVYQTDSGTDSMNLNVSDCLMFDQVPVQSLSVSNTASTTANVHLSVFE